MKKSILLIGLIAIFILVLVVGNQHFKNKIKNEGSKISEPTKAVEHEEPLKYSKDKIYIYSFNGDITIYLKGSNENSNRYIAYNVDHSKKELNKDVNSSNYDVWNLSGAYEVKRVDESSFVTTANIVSPGEWEMAIFEKGANDFIGGTQHGDEITTDIKMYVDGKEVNPEDLIKTEADNVKIVTSTDLFRDNTITDKPIKLGDHKKVYTFNKDGLTIEQEVSFDQSIELKKSYLAMLPILRKSQGKTGSQVTDTVITNYDNKEYNVSNEGFKIPEITNVKANQASISGKDSGITATVEVSEKSPDNLPTDFMLSNSELYNKFYFAFVNDGYTTKKGEVWKQTSHYNIDTKN